MKNQITLIKNIFAASLIILMISGCKKDESISPGDGSLILLKIDYQTFKFEGANEEKINIKSSSDLSIPITVDYKAPGDFGYIKLYYGSQKKLLFDATIIWIGEGQISYPKNFNNSSDYSFLETKQAYPGDEKFQYISSDSPPNTETLRNIWDAVSQLAIMPKYLSAGKKIGVMRYTPGVGLGNPETWKWIVLLSK